MLIFCAAGTSAATYGGVAEPTLWGFELWDFRVGNFRVLRRFDLDVGFWSLSCRV